MRFKGHWGRKANLLNPVKVARILRNLYEEWEGKNPTIPFPAQFVCKPARRLLPQGVKRLFQHYETPAMYLVHGGADREHGTSQFAVFIDPAIYAGHPVVMRGSELDEALNLAFAAIPLLEFQAEGLIKKFHPQVKEKRIVYDRPVRTNDVLHAYAIWIRDPKTKPSLDLGNRYIGYGLVTVNGEVAMKGKVTGFCVKNPEST